MKNKQIATIGKRITIKGTTGPIFCLGIAIEQFGVYSTIYIVIPFLILDIEITRKKKEETDKPRAL